MTRTTYWYPMSGWLPGPDGPDPAALRDAALRFDTMGVTDLVIGIDGRRLNATWNYLDGFDSRDFRADLEQALDGLFAAGFDGTISFMPLNGHYNWQTSSQTRSFWMVNATLDFIANSAHRGRVTGIVTDTEFAPTEEWRNADDAGKADILRQYAALLEGVNTRVKAFDPALLTTTYHGSYIDRGDARFLLDGVNYGDSATYAPLVDRIILPIRLTDEIDPLADHDFATLIDRAATQSAQELAALAGTGTQVLLDFEWEEAHRGLGAPNYYAQVEAAIAQAVADHPAFAGFAVFISASISLAAAL